MPTLADAQKWFLQFSTNTYGITQGDGRPWGDKTKMAEREGQNLNPWDEGCRVTPLIGGFETLSFLAEDLEKAIGQAGATAGLRAHVYIAGWRFNALRDLSQSNSWQTGPWKPTDTANVDETAIGLILRLMQAGVGVRILVWLPVSASSVFGLGSHIDEHWYLADLVQAECNRIPDPNRGIVGLDLRVAAPASAAHHQKMVVIRVGNTNVAYCGGVDMAFTRRDAPDATHPYSSDPSDPSKPAPQFLGGDWESGDGTPAYFDGRDNVAHRWPQDSSGSVIYEAVSKISPPSKTPGDLPPSVYGSTNKSTNYVWHDQHLRLEGPIVKTLEQQFIERWSDAADFYWTGDGSGGRHIRDGQVIFSSSKAIQGAGANRDVTPLPAPQDVPAVPGSNSYVQMWRTIPLRQKQRWRPPFVRGEFTVMAGIANACLKSNELILLFDQYFFSRPLARLLHDLVRDDPNQNLCVILILPPYADDQQLTIHHARKLALNDLTDRLSTGGPGQYGRIAIYNTWDKTQNKGIYVHAKAKMFDNALLVCGSANLNRRSFTCDTELDCAVLDGSALVKHQKRLWKMLFPASPWPTTIDFTQAGWGKKFFGAFQTAAANNGSFLIPDPWDTAGTPSIVSPKDERPVIVQVTPPKLPKNFSGTQINREQDFARDYLPKVLQEVGPGLHEWNITLQGQSEQQNGVIDANLDPSSLTQDIENYPGPGGNSLRGRLDQIVKLIEGQQDAKGKFPWRRP